MKLPSGNIGMLYRYCDFIPTSLLSVCLTNHVFVFSLTSYLEALIVLGAMDVENAMSCAQSQRYVYKYSLKKHKLVTF